MSPRWKQFWSLPVRPRAVLLASILLLTAASPAYGWLYWADTDNYAIGRSATNGSHKRDPFIALGTVLPCGVAISGRYLYWPRFISGAASPCGLAVYKDHLYWANKEISGSIGRANLSGPKEVHENFVPSEQASGGHDLWQPCGVAVGPTGIYWSNQIEGAIGHANLDGTGERTLIPGGLQACGVALGSSYLYWTDQGNGTIGRALLDGSQPEATYIAGLEGPCGVAVSAHYLYFSDGSTIDRTDLTSADPTAATEQIVMGTRNACGVAVH